jgi:2-methylisocitrate lyase-like PEP mutase family enzyme
MTAFCKQVPGPKMANMLEEGATPLLPPQRLKEIGYRIAAYPLTLLNSAVYAMREALADLKTGRTPTRRVDFATIRDIVGFDEYDSKLRRYADDDEPH